MTPADAIKAVREAWDTYCDACKREIMGDDDDGKFASEVTAGTMLMSAICVGLPAILARAEAFERIRVLYRTPSWKHVEGVADIIDEVEAAEKAGGL